MNKKQGSVLKNLGKGIGADIVLFAVALLVMSVFALSSLSSAYVIALGILVVVALAWVFYKRARKRTADRAAVDQ